MDFNLIPGLKISLLLVKALLRGPDLSNIMALTCFRK